MPFAAVGAVSAIFFPSAQAASAATNGNNGNNGPAQSVIVQYGSSSSAAAALVQSALPSVSPRQTLDGMSGVVVTIPSSAIGTLTAAGATVTPDEAVAFQSTGSGTSNSCPSFSSTSAPSGYFPQDTGADQLAAMGDTGRGATVAVLDTGIDGSLPDFAGRLVGGVDLTGGNSPFSDAYGHGTFVAGLIAGNGASSNGQYVGEAPGAKLVSIKVAGADGTTSVSTIVQGILWAVTNRQRLGINVLNLSLGAIPTGPTVTEPLDQAVEMAWRSGITVVTSAGNAGPTAGTILSPGDDPLAITVGAYADNNSPSPANWYACPFSSVGPTAYDGWIKPDLAAPGRSVVSVINTGSTIAQANPNAVIGTSNFVGSGTSFSTAITSGAAALVAAAHPGVAPDEVKGRLLGYALPAETQAPLIEGHGYLNAFSAVTGGSVVYNSNQAATAEYSELFTGPTLQTAWNASTWNRANWSGSAWTGSAWTGSAWTGSAWTGSAWTGGAWNGAAWNGSAWTGSAWTGSAWTASSWNGSAWTGAAWNGSAWTGSTLTGSAWTGGAWNGSAWTGGAWNGSAWTGSAWTGSAWTASPTGSAWTSSALTGGAWNGSAWTGGAWNGSAWTGSAWTGGAWNGSAWTGSAWTGSAWTGSAWTGSAWTGSAWTGGAWNGSAWTGGAWNGSAWTGSAWTGSAWTGSAWTGSAWTGSAWTGSAWTGSAWTGSAWTGAVWS